MASRLSPVCLPSPSSLFRPDRHGSTSMPPPLASTPHGILLRPDRLRRVRPMFLIFLSFFSSLPVTNFCGVVVAHTFLSELRLLFPQLRSVISSLRKLGRPNFQESVYVLTALCTSANYFLLLEVHMRLCNAINP